MMHPIDIEGVFWKRVSDEVCPVCREHRFVIVQKIGLYYTIHTRVATSVSPAWCIHAWRSRKLDPACLKCFEPTDRRPKFSINNATLTSLLFNMEVPQ